MGWLGLSIRAPGLMERRTSIGAWYLFFVPLFTILGFGKFAGLPPMKDIVPKSGVVFLLLSMIEQFWFILRSFSLKCNMGIGVAHNTPLISQNYKTI